MENQNSNAEDLTNEQNLNNELINNKSANLLDNTPENSDDTTQAEKINIDNLDLKLNENILQEMGLSAPKDENFYLKQKTQKIKQELDSNINKVEKLVLSGMINSDMGRNLKKHILQKAFDDIITKEKNQELTQNSNTQVFDEFEKQSGKFFDIDGRKDVLNYLKHETSQMSLNDLNKISEIIKIVEKSAITRYINKIAHDKSLKESNEQAKKKLTANAQFTSNGINLSQTFTREQIGKMTCAEFAKYEKAIMKQLREGKIR